MPPIAVSFPHGLEEGFVGSFKVVGSDTKEAGPSKRNPGLVNEFWVEDGKLAYHTFPLAQKGFRVLFKALASWAPPCGIDLCPKEGDLLSGSSMFSLVGALTPVDEALVEEAALFQGMRNLFSSNLGWGPLSSTPLSSALRGLVNEARHDLGVIC